MPSKQEKSKKEIFVLSMQIVVIAVITIVIAKLWSEFVMQSIIMHIKISPVIQFIILLMLTFLSVIVVFAILYVNYKVEFKRLNGVTQVNIALSDAGSVDTYKPKKFFTKSNNGIIKKFFSKLHQ